MQLVFSVLLAYLAIMKPSLAKNIMTVPEHSAAFMKAMSGGEPLTRGDFLFLTGNDWLIAIGYPLRGDYDAEAFTRALEAVISERGPDDCWAIAPKLPPALAPYVTETDVFYVLPADAPTPGKLRGPLAKAEQILRLEEAKEFTAAHRKLWTEFLRNKDLKPQVRELFARISAVLRAPETDVRLLNAWDAEGNLAACLVMDCAPQEFDAYILGAHSREKYTAHASDALFARMLESARSRGKEYIHLGLGVNEGVTRFKEKWGGVPALPYQAAAWKAAAWKTGIPAPHTAGTAVGTNMPGAVMPRPQQRSSPTAQELQRYFSGNMMFGKRLPPEQRPLAMIWELNKNGKTSWIIGTAHAFKYSFAGTFQKLFAKVDTVIFEGPLDEAGLRAFGNHGKTRDADTPRVSDLLTEEEIRHLERVVQGPQGPWAKFFNMAWNKPADVRGILSTYRPWSVFFSLYYAYLERHGWNQSVDLEAWEIAHDMGKSVIAMESIDEQIATLEGVPMDRIIKFLRHPEDWKRRMQDSLSFYLEGNFMSMFNTSTEFPTRTQSVICMRDQRFRERMRPYIEQGRTAVLVGSAHMFNLRDMLREDGFTVTRLHPSWLHKLRARFRKGAD